MGVSAGLGLGEAAQLFVSGLWGLLTWSVMSYSYLVMSRAIWLWGLGQRLHPYAGCPCPNPYALLGTESESTSAHSAQITEIDAGKT